MPAYMNGYYLDLALNGIRNDVTHVVICSQLPASYADAWTTYKLGSAPADIGAPQDAVLSGGRSIEVDAIADGVISVSGTATHYALLDTGNERLVAAQELSNSQVVTAGNVFTLNSFEITIPGAQAPD